MDNEFEKVKRKIEAEQGRPLTPSEEIEVRGLFYFSKGVQLKGRLEQEGKDRHRRRVVSAVRDFMGSPCSRVKRAPKERRLF